MVIYENISFISKEQELKLCCSPLVFPFPSTTPQMIRHIDSCFSLFPMEVSLMLALQEDKE